MVCRLESSSIGYEKKCTGHRCYRYLGWAGNHYFFDNLRWKGQSLVDESSCQHIVRLTIRRHRHHTTLGAPYLREIADRQELCIGDIERQRITCRLDHYAPEFTSDNKRNNRGEGGDDECCRLPLHPDLILRLAPMIRRRRL